MVDGVIVGSALVRAIEKGLEKVRKAVKELIT